MSKKTLLGGLLETKKTGDHFLDATGVGDLGELDDVNGEYFGEGYVDISFLYDNDAIGIGSKGVSRSIINEIVIDKSVTGAGGYIRSLMVREKYIRLVFSNNKEFVIDSVDVDVSSVDVECVGQKVYVRFLTN